MATIDRRGNNVDGTTPAAATDPNTSYAIKTPVVVATTAAITLSGQQTIDGVAIVAGDRVLVKDQSTTSTNGIYVASTGDWSRAVDADGNTELLNGTTVLATSGTVSANKQYRLTATNPVVVGTSAQVWTAIDNAPASGAFVVATSSPSLTGSRLLAGESTVVTITDGGALSSITVSLTANGVTDAKLRQSAGLSLIGRASNSTGNVADITAASDYQVFRRNGTAIGFGSIDLSQSAAVGSSILAGTNGGTGANNGAYTITIGGNLSASSTVAITGAFSTAAAFTTSGAHALTLTVTGATNVTLPTTGTLATLAGAETLSNKVLVSPTITTSIVPTTDDGSALGSTSNKFSDLFLASGGVINWNSGDVTATHSANALAFAGASSGYTFDATIAPASSDGAALGTSSLMFSDMFLASGAVVNFNNGDITLTHSADTLALAGGVFVLPNAGLQIGASVPFSDSTGTLTLQNVDALDATTETTIEAAIDTLANLTSIQGHAVTLTGALVRVGAHSLTLTTSGTTDVTLPVTGTLATLAGVEALTNKTVNGLTITASTGTLTITNGKTVAVSNSLTLAGTDSTTMTFPSTSATLARTDAGQTFTGTNAFAKITFAVETLTDLSADATPDTAADYLLTYDASANAFKKVLIDNAVSAAASGVTSVGGGTGAISVAGGAHVSGSVLFTQGAFGSL